MKELLYAPLLYREISAVIPQSRGHKQENRVQNLKRQTKFNGSVPLSLVQYLFYGRTKPQTPDRLETGRTNYEMTELFIALQIVSVSLLRRFKFHLEIIVLLKLSECSPGEYCLIE